MSDIKSQRRIAASILGRGVNGVWVDPEEVFKVSNAITREDVAKLIHDGIIKPRKIKGTSRGRARARRYKLQRGEGVTYKIPRRHKKGPGSRKGTKNARNNQKTQWINKIRKQRSYLRKLRDEDYITPHTYRKLYKQAKGNLFRSVRYLSNYIREHGLAKRRIPDYKR